MSCSNCGREITPGDKFCSYCGAALGNAGGRPDFESAEADDLQTVVAGLQAQVGRLQAQIIQQTQRIDALETASQDLASPDPALATPPLATPGPCCCSGQGTCGNRTGARCPAGTSDRGTPR